MHSLIENYFHSAFACDFKEKLIDFLEIHLINN